MDTKDIPTTPVSDWQPITDIVLLAALGKMIEELGELVNIAGRMIIQGVDGVDPASGKINIDKMADEIADAAATSHLVVELLKLDVNAMKVRSIRKIEYKRPWLENLARQRDGAA